MKKKLPIQLACLGLLALGFSVAMFSGSVKSQQSSVKREQAKPQKLKEIAMERDVEVDGVSGCDLADIGLADLLDGSRGVVYGRILDSRSYFDDSGAPIEHGEVITTEYTVEVMRVIKDRTLESVPPPDKAPPAPLMTPLKIARNGGVVTVNGHRASVKIKGYDDLLPGNRQYVFFLNWSPDHKAYNLTACFFGALIVDDDLSVRPLGPSKKLKRELGGITLERLVKQIR